MRATAMIEDLNNWWDSLAFAAKIFYAIGIFATAFIVLQALMMLFGFDGEDGDSMDGGNDDSDGDAHFLSVRTVTAFLVGFGWMGALLTRLGVGLWFVLPAASLVGLAHIAPVFFFY